VSASRGAAPREVLLLDLGNSTAKLLPLGASSPLRVRMDAADTEGARARFRTALGAAPNAVHCLAASVAPRWEALLLPELAARGVRVMLVQPAEVPLTVRSRGTGVDRLLSAWQALRLARGAALVASCGTAFTLDVVDAAGEFHGGAIGAGLGLQEAALAAAATHLPPPDPAWHGGPVPASSAEAIACGTRGALAAALNGLAAEFALRIKAPDCARFVTGGDAARLAADLGPAWRLEEHLVLRALAALAPAWKW
jgi:type III pantothenate kinase